MEELLKIKIENINKILSAKYESIVTPNGTAYRVGNCYVRVFIFRDFVGWEYAKDRNEAEINRFEDCDIFDEETETEIVKFIEEDCFEQ